MQKVILMGVGGYARVIGDLLLASSEVAVLGFLSRGDVRAQGNMADLRDLGGDENLSSFDPADVRLVNAVGSVRSMGPRKSVFQKGKALGFSFVSLRHPTVNMANDVHLAEGAHVLAGAVIQAGSWIGEDVIVNMNVSIDHDCVIGASTHLATGSVIAGSVTVGAAVLIGIGAIIGPDVSIGDGALVGAGSVVLSDVAAGDFVAGAPARRIRGVKD